MLRVYFRFFAQTNERRKKHELFSQAQNFIIHLYAECWMDMMRQDCKHAEKMAAKNCDHCKMCACVCIFTALQRVEETRKRDGKLREQSGDARKNEKSIKFTLRKSIFHQYTRAHTEASDE